MTPKDDQAPSRGYYAIAHRAGNNLHHLDLALEARADAIECDFWHANGRLVLRHERKLPALPVLYDKWFLRWAWGTISIHELLREIDRRSHLFLDIKSSTPRAAEAVLDLYREHASMMPRTRVSSNQWKLLDRIGEAGTDMELFYSIGARRNVDVLLRRIERHGAPAGTSIRHTLLSPELVGRLHEAGLQVYAWTVNHRPRFQELLSWGVDGIISDDVSLFDERAVSAAAGAPPSP